MRVLLALALAATLAQIFPSCGGQPAGEAVVIGWVEAKRFDRLVGAFYLTINSHEYEVPDVFWKRVGIGDLVRWDGFTWTIVQRASGATPTPTRTPAPPPTPAPTPTR